MDPNREPGEASAEEPSHSGIGDGSSPVPETPKKKKKEYKQIQLPSHEQMMQEDFMNNCAVRTVISGVLGAGLGVAFGIFMGTMDTTGGNVDMAAEQQSARQVFRQMVTSTRQRSWSYAKGFGVVGALFAGSECVIEKIRARHDIYNSLYAGCFAGATLAHKAGPQAMCFGCASFAAFSVVIDKFMDRP